MPITINPQLNLLLEPNKSDSVLEDSARAELVEELANLIFLFWESTNKNTITKDKINE